MKVFCHSSLSRFSLTCLPAFLLYLLLFNASPCQQKCLALNEPVSTAPSQREKSPNPPRIEAIRYFSLTPNLELTAPSDPILKSGDPLIPQKLGHMAGQLARNSGSLMRPGLNVQPFLDPAGENRVDVGFILEDRATTVRLKSVNFKGSGFWDTLNRWQLKQALGKIETRPYDKGTTISATDVIDINRIAHLYYREKGYLDAEIQLESIRFTKDQKSVWLRYQVDNGEQYAIGKITVLSAAPFPDKDLQEIGEKHESSAFTGKRLKELEEDLEKFCMKQGYMAPVVELDYTPNPSGHTVDIAAHVEAGSTSVLGRVEVIHHTLEDPPRNPDSSFQRFRKWMAPPVKDSVLRRQVLTDPGEPLNLWSIEQPETDLKQFGFLDKVEVRTRATSNTQVRDVVLEVTDLRSGRYNAAVGWSKQSGVSGMFQLAELNLAGVADRLSFDVAGSKEGVNFSINYLDRHWDWAEKWMGRKRSPSLLHTLLWTEGWYRRYSEEVRGVNWTLGYRSAKPGNWWRHNWRLRLESIDLTPSRAPDDYVEDFNDYFAATLAYHIFQDTRDRGGLSTEGYYVGASVETGMADGYLLKTMAGYEWYQSFWKKWTWMSRAEAGLMPYDADQVGIGERFQGGGVQDVRGFEVRGVGPVDAREEALHIGGSTKTLFSNELRFAVNENVIPLVFCDLGSLDNAPFSLDNWHASVGLGLRAIIPGMNNEFYVYYGSSLLSQETDFRESLHFGMRFALE